MATNKLLLQVVMFSAASGGMFYAFGLLALDFKHLGKYSQKSINLLAGLCYLFVMVIQLPMSEVIRRWPTVVAISSWFLASLGWMGLTVVSYYSPLPIWYLVLPLCALGMGIGLSGSPVYAAISQMYDPKSTAYHRCTTAFVATYALSSCIGGIIYQYAFPAHYSLALKIAWFCGAQAVVSFILVLDGLLFFRVGDPPAGEANTENSATATPEKEPPSCFVFWSGFKVIVSSLSSWLFLLICLINFGVGVNFYNNSGSMLESLGGNHTQMSVLFIVFSLSQFFGRLFCGMLMSFLIAENGPLFTKPGFAVLLVHAAASIVMLSTAVSSALWNNKIVFFFYLAFNSFAYGALWTVAMDAAKPAIVLGEPATRGGFFRMYGFLTLAPGVGPLIFDPLSGYLYDLAAVAHECVGVKCYRIYGMVVTGVEVICLMLILALGWNFYLRYRSRSSSARPTNEERQPLLQQADRLEEQDGTVQ
jgi:MFS family permease